MDRKNQLLVCAKELVDIIHQLEPPPPPSPPLDNSGSNNSCTSIPSGSVRAVQGKCWMQHDDDDNAIRGRILSVAMALYQMQIADTTVTAKDDQCLVGDEETAPSEKASLPPRTQLMDPATAAMPLPHSLVVSQHDVNHVSSSSAFLQMFHLRMPHHRSQQRYNMPQQQGLLVGGEKAKESQMEPLLQMEMEAPPMIQDAQDEEDLDTPQHHEPRGEDNPTANAPLTTAVHHWSATTTGAPSTFGKVILTVMAILVSTMILMNHSTDSTHNDSSSDPVLQRWTALSQCFHELSSELGTTLKALLNG